MDVHTSEIVHRVAVRLHWQRWAWLLPLVVAYAMLHWSTHRISLIAGAVVGLGVLVWAVLRPGSALIALVVFLPLQAIGFGFLLGLGVPGRILRPAGSLKEVLAAGILLSAMHAIRVRRTRRGQHAQLDAIDKTALAYVAVVTLYLVFPHLFTVFPVSNRWSVRLLAWRADCGYVLLFLAVRHAPLPVATRRRFNQVLMALAGLTVALAFYQWLRPASWSYLVLATGRQFEYQVVVLGNPVTTSARNLAYLIDTHPLRVSSVLLSPFDMADFLLIPLALVVERVARRRRAFGWSSYALCGAIVFALFASRVRADALAAVVLALVALAPTPQRPLEARLRLLAVIVVAAAVVVPSLRGTRFVNAQGGAQSSQGHISELVGSLHGLAHSPLGTGIGNVAGVGDRFVLSPGSQGAYTVDNSVLQVASELGIQALVPWLLMVVLTFRALGRAARRADPFAGGIRLALVALLVAGMYHHVLLSFPVAWTLWAGAGLALLPAGRDVNPEPGTPPVPSTRSTHYRPATRSDRLMELRNYARLLGRRLVLVVLTVAAGAAGGYLVTSRTPLYQARTRIYVGSRQPGNQSGSDIVQLDRIIATYAAMVKSAPVAQGAIAASHAPRTVGQVIGEVSSSVLPNTNLITLTVTDVDPGVAQALANGVAASFVTQAQDLSAVTGSPPGSAQSVSVFEPAGTPGAPLPTGLKKAVPLGAVFGFLVSIAVVLLIDYLDVGIRSTDEVERHSDLPVLGTVPLRRESTG